MQTKSNFQQGRPEKCQKFSLQDSKKEKEGHLQIVGKEGKYTNLFREMATLGSKLQFNSSLLVA